MIEHIDDTRFGWVINLEISEMAITVCYQNSKQDDSRTDAWMLSPTLKRSRVPRLTVTFKTDGTKHQCSSVSSPEESEWCDWQLQELRNVSSNPFVSHHIWQGTVVFSNRWSQIKMPRLIDTFGVVEPISGDIRKSVFHYHSPRATAEPIRETLERIGISSG